MYGMDVTDASLVPVAAVMVYLTQHRHTDSVIMVLQVNALVN